jgi:protein dithiol:quinone oxidoreductase
MTGAKEGHAKVSGALRISAATLSLSRTTMFTLTPRHVWIPLALACAGAVLASFGLTAWLDLSPCYLCIFQRTLFMLLTLLAALAALGRMLARVAGPLFVLGCAVGIGAASYQTWLQLQPPDSVSCVGGQPGIIERLVEWLAQQSPALFLATGFCEDEELVILGSSLANWALLAFASGLAAAIWALWRARPTVRQSNPTGLPI